MVGGPQALGRNLHQDPRHRTSGNGYLLGITPYPSSVTTIHNHGCLNLMASLDICSRLLLALKTPLLCEGLSIAFLAGWVATKEKSVASRLIRWALAYPIVAKRSLRLEQVSWLCKAWSYIPITMLLQLVLAAETDLPVLIEPNLTAKLSAGFSI